MRGKRGWWLGAVIIVVGLVLGVGTSAGSAPPAARMPGGYVRVAGDVPGALSRATRAAAAPGDARQPLSVTLVLNRSHPRAFTRFLAAVEDPRSPAYRHFLSSTAITARFGPSVTAYDDVVSWLRTRGFSRLRGSADRLTVTAVGSRALVERTFDVALRDFRLGGRRVYANTTNPAVPVALAPYVESVVGLSNVGEPQPIGHPSPVTAADVQIPIGPCNVGLGTLVQGDNPCKDVLADSCWDLLKAYAASAFGGEVIEDEKNFQCAADELDLVTAYAASLRKASPARAGALGARTAPGGGEKLGLLEFDTFNRSDVSNFLALQGDSASQVSQLMSQLTEQPVDGGVATPGAWEAEVLLDVDAALSLAPGAQVVVYDAPMSGTGFVDEFNAMIADHVNVISNSWVTCENLVSRSEAQAIDTVLQQAAAAGISVLNATGDTGSSCFGTPDTVGVPADSPNATAVGGSSMTPGVDGTYGGETWWDGSAATPSGGQGGYGVSRYFPRPSYQDSFTPATGRSVPDIVSNADPFKGYSICQADAGGCPTGGLFGGTSVAAPMLGALVADLDEQLRHPLGQLNQLIYPLANPTTFHDAASMGSDFAHVGLGSPNLDRLSLAISGQSPGSVDVTATDANHSTLEGLPVPGIPADGTTQDLLVARLVDANGNTVPGKDVTLAVVGTPAGSVKITPVGAGTSSNDNGTVEFAVTDTVPETVTFQATDTTDKLVLPTLDVRFVSSPADAGLIQAPSPSNPPADGTSTSTITVTLQYKGAGVSGKAVTLTADSGTHSAIVATGTTPGVTDASGNATFQVSDATAENVTYTAVDVTDGGLEIPNTVTVDFGGSAVNNEPCAASSSQAPAAAAGFAFSNFATNFSSGGCQGPIGLAFDSSGNLYAEDTFGNELYRFGPQGGSAGASTLAGTVTGNNARISGMAFGRDGELYAGEYCGDMVQLDPATGAVVRTVVANSSTMPCPTGVAIDPLSGDLFASNVGGGIITRIADPSGASGSPTPSIYSHASADGISFAPDGTLYLAGTDGCIYSLPATDSGGTPPLTTTKIACIPGGPDGIAVEPAPDSTHAQALFVNTNSGTIVELSNLGAATPTQTTVFSGGSRGDFVTVGPDGCMYATQTDRIIRLTAAGQTCPFAPTTTGPQINLVQTSPGTSSGATGSQASFKATLENVANSGGTPITFTVSGSTTLNPIGAPGTTTGPGNSQRDLVDAGSDGSGTLTYTGMHTGIDEVVARADINGTEVTSPPVPFTWTTGVDKSWLALNASPDGGAPGDPTTLAVSLLDLSGTPQPTPIGNASVTVSLQGQSCTAHTDAAGNGSCTVTPPGPVGLTAITASYAGDARHLPATATDPFVLLIGVPPTDVAPPVISGTVGLGQTLRCSTGTWTGEPISYTYAYQWSRDGAAIASGSSYTVQGADQGHSLSCTVTASNLAGAGTPATSAAVQISAATNLPPAQRLVGQVPVNTAPPHIAGTPKAGRVLSCSTGSWTGAPTSYGYRWSRDGTPLIGATGSSYMIVALDEGSTLTCAVTAINAAGAGGPATSRAVSVVVPVVHGCPRATGSIAGRRLGLLHLGMTRAQARAAYRKSSNRGRRYEDFFCLTPIGIRVGLASRDLLAHVARQQRARFRDRVVWASTSNPFYAIDGIRPGATLAAAKARLRHGQLYHVGRNYWYLSPAGPVTAILKVRHGEVQEVGIADKRLTRTQQTTSAFVHSFS